MALRSAQQCGCRPGVAASIGSHAFVDDREEMAHSCSVPQYTEWACYGSGETERYNRENTTSGNVIAGTTVFLYAWYFDDVCTFQVG